MLKKKLFGMVAILGVAACGTAGAIIANNVSASFINAEQTKTHSVTLKPGDTTINTGTPIDINFTELDFSMDGNMQKITSVSTNADGFTLEAGYRYDENPNNIFYKEIDTSLDIDATSYAFKVGEEPSRIKMSCFTTTFSEITITYSCDSTKDDFNMLESKRYVSIGNQEIEATKQPNGEYAATKLSILKGDIVKVYKKDPTGQKTDITFRSDNESKASAAYAFSDLSCIAKFNGQGNVYINDNGAWINMARLDSVNFRSSANGWSDELFDDNEDGTYSTVVELDANSEFIIREKVFLTDEEKSADWWQGFNTLADVNVKGSIVKAGENNFKTTVAGTYEIIFDSATYQTTINLYQEM